MDAIYLKNLIYKDHNEYNLYKLKLFIKIIFSINLYVEIKQQKLVEYIRCMTIFIIIIFIFINKNKLIIHTENNNIYQTVKISHININKLNININKFKFKFNRFKYFLLSYTNQNQSNYNKSLYLRNLSYKINNITISYSNYFINNKPDKFIILYNDNDSNNNHNDTHIHQALSHILLLFPEHNYITPDYKDDIINIINNNDKIIIFKTFNNNIPINIPIIQTIISYDSNKYLNIKILK